MNKSSGDRFSSSFDKPEKIKISFREFLRQIRHAGEVVKKDRLLFIGSIFLIVIPIFILGAFVASLILIFGKFL